MTFNGVDELHFFRTEDSAESLEMLKGAYKQLVSLVRHLNLQKLSPLSSSLVMNTPKCNCPKQYYMTTRDFLQIVLLRKNVPGRKEAQCLR